MRISELSQRSGVPVATIKFYLRERLLHDGELTSATQARYDDSHLARLRLIRALAGPGRLSIAAVRAVLAAIDAPPESTHALLGHAHAATAPPVSPEVDLTEARALVRRWGWQIAPEDSASLAVLATALDGMAAADFSLGPDVLDAYADAMRRVAEAEIAGVPADSPAGAVRYVVLGTVLGAPVLLALRRLAEQDASARRFGAGSPAASGAERDPS